VKVVLNGAQMLVNGHIGSDQCDIAHITINTIIIIRRRRRRRG
jgi:hypothetical protein